MTSSPAAEAYPGNPSLPQEVRQKILSTFRHALNLFSSGNLNDCLIGCEFILKMDPRFVPARTLRDRARSPEGNRDISDLQALVSPGASPAPSTEPVSAPPPPPARTTGSGEPATQSPAQTPTSARPDPQQALAEAARELAARDFDSAIAAASRALSLLPGNPEALAIVERAAAKKAMQPLVKTGLERAELALEENRLSDARMELDQMRLMDPEHPALGPLEQRLESASSAASAPGSGFSLDQEEPGPFAMGGPDRGPAFFEEAPEPAPPETQPMESEHLRPLGMDSFSLDAFPQTEPTASPAQPPQDFFAPPREAAAPPAPQPEGVAGPSAPAPPTALDLAKPPGEEGSPIPGSEREIAALLKQGDEMARKGDREQAIEIWSRVFLIDINNMGAVTRIEKVRQEMAEESRLIADCLKKGRENFEAGQFEEARRFFTQVQSIHPDEPTARFYLERISEGTKEAAGSPAPEAPPRPAEPAGRKDAAVSKPAPASLEAVAAPVPSRPAFLGIPPRVLAVVGAFLVMTLIGAYFVFKGPRTRSSPPQAAAAGSLAHARQLLSRGKLAEARAELRRIPPGDPNSGEAQRLLEELGKPGGAEALAARGARPTPPGGELPAAGGEGDPARLRSAGEQALGEKRYIDALKNLNLAAPAYRNDPGFAQEQAAASEKVAALTPAVKLYNEGEYETAIPILWRLVQEDRDNRDARSYLLRAYYNQGITQLQNGLYPKAAQAFQEALSLDPNDAEAARHKRFAMRYQKADLDLMGRIYVRHLNHRP